MPIPRPASRRWLAWSAVIALFLCLPPVAVLWLAFTESGLVAAADLAQRLSAGTIRIEGAHGRLAGPLRVLAVRYSDGNNAAVIRELALDWQPAALAHGELRIHRLSAGAIELRIAPSERAARVPASLALPLDVDVTHLSIGRLVVQRTVNGTAVGGHDRPFELDRLAASVLAGARRHELRSLSASGRFGRIEASGWISAEAPFELAARAALGEQAAGHEHRIAASAAGTIQSFEITADGSWRGAQASAQAEILPFAPAPIRRLRLDAGEIDPARIRAGLPRAAVSLHAELEPVAGAHGDSAPDGLELAGRVELLNRSPGPLDRGALPLARARSSLRWAGTRVDLEDLVLEIPGSGLAAGRAGWDGRNGGAELAIRGLDLARIHAKVKPTRLSGKVRAEFGETGQAMTADLADARFELAFEARRTDDRLRVRRARLSAGGAELSVEGTLGLSEPNTFELAGRLKRFDPSAFVQVPAARLNAVLAAGGRLGARPEIDLEFRLEESRVLDQPLAGQGRVVLAQNRLAQAEVTLSAGQNRIRASGAYGAPGDRLAIEADLPRLAGFVSGLAGRVRASAELTGTPGEPTGSARLEVADLAIPGGHRLRRANAGAQLAGGYDGAFAVSLEADDYRGPGGDRLAVGSARLQVEGTRSDHGVRAVLTVGGRETIELAARGAIAAPLEWSGRIESFAVRGKTPFAMRLESLATLVASASRVALTGAQLDWRGARLRLARAEWSPGRFATSGELRGLSIGVDRPEGKRSAWRGEGFAVGGTWDLEAAERLNGRIRFAREGGDIVLAGERDVALGLEQLRIEASARDDRIELAGEAAGRNTGRFSARITAWAERGERGWTLARGAPIEGELRSSVPSVEWLGPLAGASVRFGGSLEIEAIAGGTPAQPQLRGTARGAKLSIAHGEHGFRVRDGVLDATFDESRLVLRDLSFAGVPGSAPRQKKIDWTRFSDATGRIGVQGEYRFADRAGRFEAKAERLPVFQRGDRWLVASGEASLGIEGTKGRLVGSISADAGYFEVARAGAPRLSDDVVVIGREEATAGAFPLAAEIDIDLGRRMFVGGHGADARLVGRVRLVTDGAGGVRADGTINARDGTFNAYGVLLDIERGVVTFAGPVNNPSLNVLALRRNLPVEAGVEVTGTARNPIVRLVSVPDVPEAEKLSWIVFGRGLDQKGAASDAVVLAAAASSLLGGPSADRMMRDVGLDQLTIGAPDDAYRRPATVAQTGRPTGSDELSEQIVSVGKRISDKATLSYERSLAGASDVVKLTYQLSRRLSIITRAGTENAIDLFYTFAFD